MQSVCSRSVLDIVPDMGKSQTQAEGHRLHYLFSTAVSQSMQDTT